MTGRAYPELTWTAVGVGWILGVIIAISIGYAALILGFSIEGSELAAILGFGIAFALATVRVHTAPGPTFGFRPIGC